MNMKNHFKCNDCRSFNQGPMVEPDVWRSIASKDAILCLDCIEARLGRQLSLDDLPMNGMNHALITMVKRNAGSAK